MGCSPGWTHGEIGVMPGGLRGGMCLIMCGHPSTTLHIDVTSAALAGIRAWACRERTEGPPGVPSRFSTTEAFENDWMLENSR
jgi:hypothetical protein